MKKMRYRDELYDQTNEETSSRGKHERGEKKKKIWNIEMFAKGGFQIRGTYAVHQIV